MVLLTPALAALHVWRPDLRLSVLVEPEWRAVLEGNPAVSEILIARGFAATALTLRRKRFPTAFNQHGGPRSAFLTAATGAAARVCWKGKQFDFLYNVLAPDAVEFYGTLQVHTVEQRMTQIYWTGLPRGPIPRAGVSPQADARQRIGEILAARGVAAGEPYAVIQPGGRYFTKRSAIDYPLVLDDGQRAAALQRHALHALSSCRLAGVRFRARASKTCPSDRACIFMSNHVSNLDPPALISLIPGRTSAFMKRSLMELPILGTGFRQGEFIAVDRSGNAADAKRSVAEAAARAGQRRAHHHIC